MVSEVEHAAALLVCAVVISYVIEIVRLNGIVLLVESGRRQGKLLFSERRRRPQEVRWRLETHPSERMVGWATERLGYAWLRQFGSTGGFGVVLVRKQRRAFLGYFMLLNILLSVWFCFSSLALF